MENNGWLSTSFWSGLVGGKKEDVLYSCNQPILDDGCYFTYCGKEKKTDLLTLACPDPAVNYSAGYNKNGSCTYKIIEYAEKYGKYPTGYCRMTRDHDEYPGVPYVGYKKGFPKEDDCPLWVHAPQAPKKEGANDQYCKEHPEDSIVCNPSAG